MSSNVFRLLFILWQGSHYSTDSYRLTSAGTRYFAAVAVLNMYAVHDLSSLDAYTLRIVHEQNSVVARGKTMCALLLTCYKARNVIHAYIVHMLHASILWNFSSDSHASVKFKLSYTVLQIMPILPLHRLVLNWSRRPISSPWCPSFL